MFSILVVDDNKYEREGIKKLIEKNHDSFLVTLAKNGEEALNLLEKKKFDVLLTDLKMPKINGIDLIVEALKVQSDLISIIYSAYGEFEIAQRALTLGVIRYLIKPMNIDDFNQLMNEVINLCEKKEGIEFSKFIENINDNTSSYFNLINRIKSSFQFGMYGYLLNGKGRLITSKPILKAKKENILFKNKQGTIFIISHDNLTDNNLLDIWFSFYPNMSEGFSNKTILKFQPKFDIREIHNVLRLSNEKQQFFNLKEWEISSTKIHTTKSIEQNFENFFISLSENNDKKLDSTLKKIKYFFMRNTYINLSEVKYFLLDFAKRIGNTNLDKSIYHPEEEPFPSFETFINFMKQQYEISDQEKAITNNIVRDALNLINNNLSNPSLSVSFVSESLNITPNYLSALFKEEVGVGISKVVTNKRINLAKSLLIQTNLKVGEIGYRCGYNKDSYFIQQFKKIVGITPIQFRKEGNK